CLDQELGLIGLKGKNVSIQYFPDEKPGTPIAKAMRLSGIVFDIDNKSLTHRPDLWGHYGIAREFAAMLGTKLKKYEANQKFPGKGEALKIEVKDSVISPRFCACLISGIKVAKSPDWLKKKLASVGINTINNIVDVTNYVMIEYGQPMHAYDRDIVKSDRLVVDFAKNGEEVEAIDHKKYKLTSKDPTITNGKSFLGVAGIMGGLDSEINDNTTSVILEAANWNSGIIRRTSTGLGLRSDASQRFEKALDPEMCEVAVKKGAELILKCCPNAKIISRLVDIKNYKKATRTITLDPKKAVAKIGIPIETKEIIQNLRRLEFEVKEKKDLLEVTVPSFRATKDIENEDDLIEEAARLHGYDEIPPVLPDLPIKLPEENHERVLKHKARQLISYGLGFTEVSTYSFYGRDDFVKCGIPEELHMMLENYLSGDQTHMRVSLVPNLLKVAARNLRYENEFKIYEIGRTYENLQEYFPKEEKKITGLIVRKKGEVFYEAKGALEKFLRKYGAPKLELVKGHSLCTYAHPAKYAEYKSEKDTIIARVLELNPQMALNFELSEVKIGIFEINFTELVKLGQADKKYKKVSRFPSIDIDISVLVNKTKEARDLEKTIAMSDPELITSIELFDIYEGETIEKGKKALAYKVTLQREDRTLNDDEMTKVQKQIFKNLEKEGGTIRGLN
ncbi:phenylalanine--tRNA ligase subunit beta, partial [Patescibacteria group bacterium]|nr:phenylalanine--tRNA ligase subunit beta [Patescibacteria group bacterium]